MVAPPRKPAVLVVDDDPLTLAALARVLHRGFTVHTAPDARTALIELENHSIDLLITDHDMPETTGAELLAVVRVQHPQVRRVMCSAFAPAPCDDAELVVDKPWPRDLPAMLTTLLSA